jgi:hypothetical protein
MMPVDDKLTSARESRGVLNAECKVQNAELGRKASCESAPSELSLNLHFKGFGGGVPLNTERAAVKPRVGIE